MRNFQKYKHRPWFRTFRKWSGQLIVPFIIFQFIRTIFLPTIFDVLLLALFIVIAVGIWSEII
ncbi:hypothetical protein [Neobacillus kokaensis]|uniref:Membrane protein YszA n=1 Tax=Neobacillus kokaensis TaxID=2759023 RepID=A0ABQ3MZ93_9BACI|nr:hypothetical protein [Neobacillus kokaensis]GHH97201.1 hypothetical protein AM1BK_07440 [Neobacillus kokaensis]